MVRSLEPENNQFRPSIEVIALAPSIDPERRGLLIDLDVGSIGMTSSWLIICKQYIPSLWPSRPPFRTLAAASNTVVDQVEMLVIALRTREWGG
jgi:hypothetical protein